MKNYGGGELYEGGPKNPYVPGKAGDQTISDATKAQPYLTDVEPETKKGYQRQMPVSAGEGGVLADINATKPGMMHGSSHGSSDKPMM